MEIKSRLAAIGGLFLGETMSGHEIAGCIIMFAAFVISQLPDRKSPPPEIRS